MICHSNDISSITVGNAILQECFKYEQTKYSTSAYDLAQYITIVDTYIDQMHGTTYDYYVYADGMWIPMLIKNKFYNINMHDSIDQYIPRAGEKTPMVQDLQIRALAAFVVTTFFNFSPMEKNEWINQHCLFEQISPDWNQFQLFSTNHSII
mgnify:FL=1